MLPASRFPLPALILSIVAMFFAGCETDYVVSDDLSPAEGPLECIHKDCVTGTNPDVAVVSSEQKTEIPLLTLQTAFLEHYPIFTHLQRFNDDGYPAWDAINVKALGTAYRHYLVPVYKPSSPHTEAIVSILHHLEGGIVTIDYLDRDNITSFPVFATTILRSKTGEHMSQRFTLEANVYMFSDFDKLLFGGYDMNIVNLLDEEARLALLGKDCKEVMNYEIFSCQDIVGGQNGDIPLYTECTYVGTVIEFTGEDGVGCGGGTPPAGPGIGTIGSGGSGGGGGGGGGVSVSTGGPGVIIINTDPNDPNNRCIEDGVGCDEDEEDDDEPVLFAVDSFRLDTSLVNYPCAEEVIGYFTEELNNDLALLLTSLFQESIFLNVEISAGYLRSGLDGLTQGFSAGPFFTSETILNDRYLNCSKDHILATVTHEVLHGYTQYQRIQIGADSLSSIYGFTSSADINDDDHFIMAQEYVTQLSQLLIDANPSLDSIHAVHLAWSGLEDTNSFKNLPESFKQQARRTQRSAKCEVTANTGEFGFDDCN